MLCPRCATDSPGQAARCVFCGEPLSPLFSPAGIPAPEARPETAPGGNGGKRRTAAAIRGRRSRPSTAAPDTGDHRIARLIRQVAAGSHTPPETHFATSREEQEDDILRDLLSEAFEIGRRMERQRSSIDCGPLRYLYTARSFSSPEEMGRATRVVRLLLESNRRAAGQMQRAVARVKGRIEATAWSRVEKRKFWRDVTEGFVSRFQIRDALLDRQREWTEATIELYEFVLFHSDVFSFEGRLVRSRDDVAGREFLAKLNHAKQCREEFRRETLQAETAQDALLEKWGFRDFPR
jgi:hypothetical protein